MYQRLLEKLERAREALGGQVFDVLGQVFSEKSLRDLLIEAVRYGELPETRARLDQVIDVVIDEDLRRVVHERALTSDLLSASDVEEIREQMEQAEARRLQPYFIRSFFLEAFGHLGGTISQREEGRYEITHVPADVRNRDRLIGAGAPLLRRYERVTFDKPHVTLTGKPSAQFLSPGHPLLGSVVDLIQERCRDLLKRGAILVDPGDEGERLRLLLYLEHTIQDARLDRNGNRRVVSRRLQFIEVLEDRKVRAAGYAPYLDYRELETGEEALIRPLLEEEWLTQDVEQIGLNHAIQEVVPEHLDGVRRQTLNRIEKTRVAVRDRLTKEINYWDQRANELKLQELAGKKPKLNSGKARQLRGERAPDENPDIIERLKERVERLAVDAVLQTEATLGRTAVEMPHNNPGYDILSKDPTTGDIFFIEVKGRVADATTVTVTKNEILTGLNKPNQFILALARIHDDDSVELWYARRPFKGDQETFFKMTSANYNFAALAADAEAPA